MEFTAKERQSDNHTNRCKVLTVVSPCEKKFPGPLRAYNGNLTHSEKGGVNEAQGKGINVPGEGITCVRPHSLSTWPQVPGHMQRARIQGKINPAPTQVQENC